MKKKLSLLLFLFSFVLFRPEFVLAQPSPTASAPQPGRLPTMPQIGPIPPPYIPCNVVRSPEFHSLRPYQASPCNQSASDLALFCGNDIILNEIMEIEKLFFFDVNQHNFYMHEGAQHSPVAPCTLTQEGDVWWERCTFEIPETRNFAVDLSNSYLPIMGNTEQVPNSVTQSPANQLNNAVQVNEYVSWYLNGVNERAENPPLDMNDAEDINRQVSYSGPLKRLLSFESQVVTRRDEVVAAVNSLECNPNAVPADPRCVRHDQVVACTSGRCYPGGSGQIRLSGFADAIPPLRRAYDTFQEYWQNYLNWRNRSISRFFKYIPFSTTEDRKGLADVVTAPTQPISEDITLINVYLTNVIPADLFFAHMQESVELADLLQSTFVAEELNRGATATTNVQIPRFCDVRDIRNNPGDNLFAGEVSATVNYTARVSCDFIVNDPIFPGNACRGLSRLPGSSGGAAECVAENLICETTYGRVDCGLDQCASADSCIEPFSGTAYCNSFAGYSCEPEFLNCASNHPVPGSGLPSSYYCNGDGNYKCASGCSDPGQAQLQTEQLCEVPYYIRVGMITKTPLANEAWSRLVAGPAGVFKRFAPKIEEGAPIEALLDLPAASPVSYSSNDGAVIAGNPILNRPGSAAEIYFPHIGGIHQYFLKCIQTILRPEGYGEYCPTGVITNTQMLSCGEGIPELPRADDSCSLGSCSNPQINMSSPTIQEIFNSAASYFHVPAGVLVAVFYNEGGFNFDWTEEAVLSASGPNCGVPDCESSNVSSSGAMGPWQFLPGTWNAYSDAVLEAGINDGRIPNICNLLDATFAAAKKLASERGGAASYVCNNRCAGVELNNLEGPATSCNWDSSDIVTAARQYLGYCEGCSEESFSARPGCFDSTQVNACYQANVLSNANDCNN